MTYKVRVSSSVKGIIEEQAKAHEITQSQFVGKAVLAYMKTEQTPQLIDKGKGAVITSLYFTKTEKELLKTLAEINKISQSKYVASLIRMRANLHPIDNGEILTQINKLSRQTRGIGINLNQITKAINKGGKGEMKDFEPLVELLGKTIIQFEQIKILLSTFQKSLKRF